MATTPKAPTSSTSASPMVTAPDNPEGRPRLPGLDRRDRQACSRPDRRHPHWHALRRAAPASELVEHGGDASLDRGRIRQLLVASAEIAERCVEGKIPEPVVDDAAESVIYFTGTLGGWREIAPEAVDAIFAKEKP